MSMRNINWLLCFTVNPNILLDLTIQDLMNNLEFFAFQSSSNYDEGKWIKI